MNSVNDLNIVEVYGIRQERHLRLGCRLLKALRGDTSTTTITAAVSGLALGPTGVTAGLTRNRTTPHD